MNKNNYREKVVFIGAGKVASGLAIALKKKRKIVQVYSRSAASAKKLVGKLSCAFTNSLKEIDTTADIYIIAVKDDAIATVASALRLIGKTVVHTSGAVDMDVLHNVSKNIGVFYPPHSFTDYKALSESIPFCIESSNAKVKKQLTALVKDLHGKVYYMNSVQRAYLHVAGVFANNFTNHLFGIADDIAGRANIPFELIMHLIQETVDMLKHNKPHLNQTGPAIRGDVKTLKKHEQLLKNNPRYLAIYKLLSKSIQELK